MSGVVFFMGDWKNIIKVSSIYITTIIGAGFASGQEIMQFFSRYYQGGFYGILMAGLLFSLIGYIVLDKVRRERIRNYDEFIFPTMGWFMGWIMQLTVTLFMLCVFCIMLAGMGNLVSQAFGLSYMHSILLMDLFCMFIILTDIKGIITISSFITPAMILGLLSIGIYVLVQKDTSVFMPNQTLEVVTDNWFFSALLYVSYNSIMSVVVMCTLLPYLKNHKTVITGSILSGGILCGIALLLNSIIFLFYPGIYSFPFPILTIVQKYSTFFGGLYTLILWLAMFTSAVTSGFCFVERFGSKTNINFKLLTVIFCPVAIPLSSFGFSNLIATLYPIFGYMGLFTILVILFQGFRSKYASWTKKPKKMSV